MRRGGLIKPARKQLVTRRNGPLIHLRRQERPARAEFLAHQRQAQDPALEAVREAREERRFLLRIRRG